MAIALFPQGFCLTLPRYLGQDKAFCSDPTLTLSLSNPTITCQIVGKTIIGYIVKPNGLHQLGIYKLATF